MKNKTPKVTIHMVASLDGFIAKKDNSVSWMHSRDQFDKGKVLTDEDISAFLQKIDCYVMGSRTYEHALQLGWPYGDKPVIVLTSRDLSTEKQHVEFHSGDLQVLLNDNLKSRFSNIWMVGGAALTKDFLRLGLADKLVISIMPVLLGDGMLFFDYVGREVMLHLEDVTAYKDGMVELSYALINEN